MKKYLFYLALIGWTMAVLTNVLALAQINIGQYIPYIWVLHIGIFAVWIPVVFDLRGNKEIQELNKNKSFTNFKSQFGIWNIIFKETPKWMKIIAISGFFYAFFNFAIFMISMDNSSPHEKNGKYTLQNHGELIREISEEEYHEYKALEIRGFSGHWIVFYGIATAILFKHSHFAEKKKNTSTTVHDI